MAKARCKLADILSRWSKWFFQYLTDREDTSWLACWLKQPILGLFVIAIGWLTAGSVLSSMACCYAPLMTEPDVYSTSVAPNPTEGADSVTVTATVEMHNPPSDESVYIEEAICILDADTTEMNIEEGEWRGEKNLEARLYVGDLITDLSYKIQVEATNNNDEIGYDETFLDVTEAPEE